MPAKELNLSKGEQFLAGLAIGVGIFVVARFGGRIIVSQIVKRAPKLLTKKFAEHIVHDQVLGRIPILDPKHEITKVVIITSIANTLFWIFGGMETLIDLATSTTGFDTIPIGKKLGNDELKVEDDGRTWVVTSRGGQLQYATINGARVDP